MSERAIHSHLKGDYVQCGEHCVCVFTSGTCIHKQDQYSASTLQCDIAAPQL